MNRTFSVFLFCLFLISPLFSQNLPVADPDPEVYREEMNRFRFWDAKNSFPDSSILFVGSSSIVLWRTNEAFPDYPVINRGFGGSHYSDQLAHYDIAVKPYNPQWLVLYCGDNDIAAGKEAERVFKNYQELMQRIHTDFPKAKLVYVPIKPSRSRWSFWPEMSRFNKMVENYCSGQDWLYYLDFATPLLGADGLPDTVNFVGDQLHLSAEGYKKWNAILRPFLKKHFQQPVSPAR